jgi:hypothetical protein
MWIGVGQPAKETADREMPVGRGRGSGVGKHEGVISGYYQLLAAYFLRSCAT